MIKKFFLLRHCSTTDSENGINGSQSDTPLSPKGLLDAERLVAELSKYTYDLIVVSPLQRTIQSIAPYLHTLSHKPTLLVEPLTIERNLGTLTNTHESDGKISADMRASGKSKTEWIPPGGESTVSVYQRARQFLRTMSKRSESTILICGHQNFLRCLELILREVPIDDEQYDSTEYPKLGFGELRTYAWEVDKQVDLQ